MAEKQKRIITDSVKDVFSAVYLTDFHS